MIFSWPHFRIYDIIVAIGSAVIGFIGRVLQQNQPKDQ